VGGRAVSVPSGPEGAGPELPLDQGRRLRDCLATRGLARDAGLHGRRRVGRSCGHGALPGELGRRWCASSRSVAPWACTTGQPSAQQAPPFNCTAMLSSCTATTCMAPAAVELSSVRGLPNHRPGRSLAGTLPVAGARMVELGAGCGLTGCVAAALGAHVILTDQVGGVKSSLTLLRGPAAGSPKPRNRCE
jgi:hypothetical protein